MIPYKPHDPEQISRASIAMERMMQWIQLISKERRLFEAYVSIFK